MKTSTNTENFKALGNKTRLEILKFLSSSDEQCVCKIYKHLKLPQNLISHHLRILREADLITARKDGKWMHYSLNRKELKKLKNMLDSMIDR